MTRTLKGPPAAAETRTLNRPSAAAETRTVNRPAAAGRTGWHCPDHEDDFMFETDLPTRPGRLRRLALAALAYLGSVLLGVLASASTPG
jgi:hypothetical protein